MMINGAKHCHDGLSSACAFRGASVRTHTSNDLHVKLIPVIHIKSPSFPLFLLPSSLHSSLAPPPSLRFPHSIAWAGGKITSNKEEATLQFLRRKQAQGNHTFTPEQLALLKRMTGTEGGGTERGVIQTTDGKRGMKGGTHACEFRRAM